ncbi:hypothetical protein AAHA92_11988 [Salvia divinorum]|uniref:Uncharacterized protein n=1 Tax=Salvia divinorum TaxID=28513 RepID=A0ABD1HIV6_SALDI
MNSMLFQTGSGPIPVQAPPASPRHSISVYSPRRPSIRRSSSESNVIRSDTRTVSRQRSRSFSSLRIPEELGTPGGGMNKNRNSGGSGGSGGGAEGSDIGAYYQEMIRSNPTNSLLLRNYGRYLHEVVGDVVKAEEYYGRAILASPGDGEVLSLYGNLIWETHRDQIRAKSYFTQAIQASPNDSMVLGSYAHFLWVAEEEECGDDEEMETELVPLPSMIVSAF